MAQRPQRLLSGTGVSIGIEDPSLANVSSRSQSAGECRIGSAAIIALAAQPRGSTYLGGTTLSVP